MKAEERAPCNGYELLAAVERVHETAARLPYVSGYA